MSPRITVTRPTTNIERLPLRQESRSVSVTDQHPLLPSLTLRSLLALAAGALTPLGFAPFDWWPLGILGVATAGLLGLILAYFVPNLPAIPPAWAVISGLGVSMIVGIFFGLWPAFKAASLDPIESLRYE